MSNLPDKSLKAYVRYDNSGRIIPGSVVLRRRKPYGKFKEFINPATYECCNPTSTSTTTTTTTTEGPR